MIASNALRANTVMLHLYSTCSPGACYAWKNLSKPWGKKKTIESMEKTRTILQKSMNTLGISMNTTEKPTKTMEKMMNSANGKF